MHYYQHNIGDYARDTSHLTVIEHGIYRLLLDWCYLNEKPIPTDRAMRVGRGYPSETHSVLSEFFIETSDGWEHRRVSAEIEKYHRKAEANRENGKKGGRPKPKENPLGCDPPPSRNPNQEPITKNQEPIKELSPYGEEPPAGGPPVAERPDPIWGTGLAFLTRKGIPDRSARQLLGKLRKAAGDVRTGAILAEAEAQDISDPAPWLMAAAARSRDQRPSAAADFRGKTYTGTPIDELPESLR
jgi:uncharacterized protein YdaU (DUF1376 family)